MFEAAHSESGRKETGAYHGPEDSRHQNSRFTEKNREGDSVFLRSEPFRTQYSYEEGVSGRIKGFSQLELLSDHSDPNHSLYERALKALGVRYEEKNASGDGIDATVFRISEEDLNNPDITERIKTLFGVETIDGVGEILATSDISKFRERIEELEKQRDSKKS